MHAPAVGKPMWSQGMSCERLLRPMGHTIFNVHQNLFVIYSATKQNVPFEDTQLSVTNQDRLVIIGRVSRMR